MQIVALWDTSDNTQREHNASAFGRIATEPPLITSPSYNSHRSGYGCVFQAMAAC